MLNSQNNYNKSTLLKCPYCSAQTDQLKIINCCFLILCTKCIQKIDSIKLHQCPPELFAVSQINTTKKIEIPKQQLCNRCNTKLRSRYCYQCPHKFLCKICYLQIHKSSKFINHHYVEIKNNLNDTNTSQLQKSLICQYHDQKPRNYVLQNNCLGCIKCSQMTKLRRIRNVQQNYQQNIFQDRGQIQQQILKKVLQLKLNQVNTLKLELGGKWFNLTNQIKVEYERIINQLKCKQKQSLDRLQIMKNEDEKTLDHLFKGYKFYYQSINLFKKLQLSKIYRKQDNIWNKIKNIKYQIIRQTLKNYQKIQKKIQQFQYVRAQHNDKAQNQNLDLIALKMIKSIGKIQKCKVITQQEKNCLRSQNLNRNTFKSSEKLKKQIGLSSANNSRVLQGLQKTYSRQSLNVNNKRRQTINSQDLKKSIDNRKSVNKLENQQEINCRVSNISISGKSNYKLKIQKKKNDDKIGQNIRNDKQLINKKCLYQFKSPIQIQISIDTHKNQITIPKQNISQIKI